MNQINIKETYEPKTIHADSNDIDYKFHTDRETEYNQNQIKQRRNTSIET